MIHRHLELAPGTPVEDLPLAAIQDLLERGDLEDWRPLLRHIEENPRGEIAQKVERLVDVYPMYGTSSLFRAWIERCRLREPRAPERRSGSLADLRRSLQKTQIEIAQAIGISQSDYSKLERRRDVRVSTLRSVASAMNGQLVLVIDLPEGSYEIELGCSD